MSRTAKQRAAQRRRGEAKQASQSRRPQARAPSKPSQVRTPSARFHVIPLLAGAATLFAAIPPLWPSMGSEIGWWRVFFAVAVGLAGLLVARTTAELWSPGDAAANAKTGVVLALVVVVPMLFDPRAVDNFSLPKLTAALIGAIAILAIWVVQAVQSQPGPRWRNGLHWPVLAFVGWTAITTATSSIPRVSLLGVFGSYDGMLTTAALVVIFFGVVQVVRIDKIKAVLSVLYFGAGGLTVLYGLIQLHDRLVAGPAWDWVPSSRGPIYSGFGNQNLLAGFLAVLVPVGCVLLMLHRSRAVRSLIVAIMAGLLIELLHTASRGALLATMVSLGVVAALMWSDLRRRPKTSFPLAGAVVAAVVIGAVALAAQPRFSARLSSSARLGRTLTLRADLWSLGVATTNGRPIVGHGPDTWIDRAPRFQDTEKIGTYSPEGYYSNGAHNLFVGQMAATGYPGLVLLLAVLGYASMRAVGTWRRLRQAESDDDGDEAIGAHEARLCLVAVAGGLMAYVVQACFNLNQVGLSFVFWFLLGLICALSLGVGVPISLRARDLITRPVLPARLGYDAEVEGRTPPPPNRARHPEGIDVTTGAVVVFVCAGLAFAAFTATRPLRASHNAWAADAATVAAGRATAPDEAARLSQQAATRLARATTLDPWEAGYQMVNAEIQVDVAVESSSAAALQAARRFSERAIELRPYSSFYLERHANVFLKIDRIDPGGGEARAEAVRALRRAVAANPYSTRLRERLNALVGS